MGEPEPPELATTVADSPRPELAATIGDTGPSPRADHEVLRGTTIGRYLLLDVLGVGGMGIVYRAYDPELDRKVALKLVQYRERGSLGETDGRGRMLREAQAIARLSHPNVVAIHDVGTSAQQVFIAMELVDGDTLAAWSRAGAHGVAEILDVFVQAGRGLAAAHAAGLVHRDFKPDNLLVGKDGRARVVDFGLVREADRGGAFDTIVEPTVRPSEPMLSTPLTQQGAVMGTPLYMAPEQMLDRTLDARTDQYSFCVALYEALAGTLPYRGDTFTEVKAKVLAGDPPPIPAAKKVPAHVAAAIRRGLSVQPEARWPAMDDLLAELRRDPGARRRRIVWSLAGIAALGIAVAIPLVVRGGGGESPCEGARDQIARAWGPAKKAALSNAFAATHAPFADAAFAAVSRRLDQYADGWSKSYEDSCRATHVRHEQSDDMLDLRTACLDRRRTEVAELVELLLASDAKGLQRAHTAVAGLSPIDDCDDVAALQAPTKLPADPAAKAAIAAAREELARVTASFQMGKYPDALPRAKALDTRARATAYEPLEAESGLVLAQIQNRTGDHDGAQQTYVAALAAATASKSDAVATRIAIGLVYAMTSKEDFARGHEWMALAEAFAERAGNQPLLLAFVYSGKGYLLSGEGKHAASAEEHERARAIRERLAPGSQELAKSLTSIANEDDEIGRYADARAAGERGLVLQEAELGPLHPDVATVLNLLGNIATDEGDLTLAKTYYNRALAIREKTVLAGDEPALLAGVLNNLGAIADEEHHYDEAIALFRRALAIREKLDPDGSDVAMSLNNLAEVQRHQGDHAGALAGYRRSLDIANRRLGKDHPFVGDALYGIGACTWQSHALDESQAALERALAIRKLGARPVEIAEVQFALARTVWDRGDKKRALDLAASARAAFAASVATKTQLAEVDAWLVAHAK